MPEPLDDQALPKNSGNLFDGDQSPYGKRLARLAKYKFTLTYASDFHLALFDAWNGGADGEDRVARLSALLDRPDLAAYRDEVYMAMAEAAGHLGLWTQAESYLALVISDTTATTYRPELDLWKAVHSTSGSGFINPDLAEPMLAYLDSVDDYKRTRPEASSSAALLLLAKMYKQRGLNAEFEFTLKRLATQQLRPDTAQADTEFMRRRLAQTPAFALLGELYYIRLEDRATLELALHLSRTTAVRAKRSEAIDLLERLLNKHSAVEIPNLGVMTQLAELYTQAGRRPDAKNILAQVIRVLDGHSEADWIRPFANPNALREQAEQLLRATTTDK